MIGLTFLLVLAAVTWADPIRDAESITGNTAYGYLTKIGIPAAERRRQLEAQYADNQRIVGGSAAALGQFPYQAGLIISLVGITGQAVCGGSLISHKRVLTAGHCWYDGQNRGREVTVVLGSVLLFSGGYRDVTSDVTVHPSWVPTLVRNDVAIVKLDKHVTFSDVISPVSLPSHEDMSDTFAGEMAIASGFGLTKDGGSLTTNQFLSHVEVDVIPNRSCWLSFPFIVQDSNICISGKNGKSTCSGDSGGPLVVKRKGHYLHIGTTSFGSALGCEMGFPGAFARTTSFMNFIKEHL